MLYVDEILYRKITPADFKNIEAVKKPEGGGGQTYIDLSGIEPERIVEFCKYGRQSPGSPKVEGGKWPVFDISVIPIGSTRSAHLTIYLRRKNNYSIAKQTLRLDRHPAWRPEAGFPTITGPHDQFISGRKYDDNLLDPVVNPITEKLSIYIVRTRNHHDYFAGYIYADAIPSSWPKDAKLQTLLSSNWDVISKEEGRGILKPRFLLEFNNSVDGTFSK